MQLIGLALALDVALLVVLAGCGQQAKTTTPSTTAQPESPPTPPPPPAVQEQPPTAPPADSAASGAPQNLDEFADEPALKDVLFEPNRADIVRDGASIMMGNARWLVARWLVDNRDYFVLLEATRTPRRPARTTRPSQSCGRRRPRGSS